MCDCHVYNKLLLTYLLLLNSTIINNFEYFEAVQLQQPFLMLYLVILSIYQLQSAVIDE